MIKHTVLLFFALLAPLACAQGAEPTLDAIYSQYNKIQVAPTVADLVHIDGLIRKFMKDRPENQDFGDDVKDWKDEYAKLGLVFGHYTGNFYYSGKLLVNAHELNPRSKYREYTLFSKIMGIEGGSGSEMPDIKIALQYVREFPRGPFIEDTYLIIAGFYKDLFMVLRDDVRDYKYYCYLPFIEKSPRLAQMSQAKSNAKTFYKKALRLNPANAQAKKYLNEVEKGVVEEWSFCSD